MKVFHNFWVTISFRLISTVINQIDMKIRNYVGLSLSAVMLFSCVSQKQMKQQQAKYGELNGAYLELQGKYRTLQDEQSKCNSQVADLNTKNLH